MKPIQLLFFSLIFLVICVIPSQAIAGDVADYFAQDSKSLRPLTSRNQTPLLNLFYLMPVTSAPVLEKGTFEFRVDFDISQTFEVNNNTNYGVNFDQEIYRTSFQLSYAIWDQMEIHLEIPTLASNNGFLDGFINDYHSAFGFPDGGRSGSFADQYGYAVTQNGVPFVNYGPIDFGMGDMNLDFKWAFLKDEGWIPSLALRTGVKFPTGSFQNGTGSGGWDAAVGFAVSKSIKRFHLYSGLDAIFFQKPDAINFFLEQGIIHWFFGTEFTFIKDQVSLLLQLDGQNTPYIPTGLPQFDNYVLDLVFGVKGSHFKERLLWSISMREDMIPDSTTDFAVSFSLGTRL